MRKQFLVLLAIVCLALLLVSCSDDDDGGMMGAVDRFVVNGDGTVTDMDTSLVWLEDVGCLGVMNWTDATAVVAQLADGQCGLTDASVAGDWRLPTLECLVFPPDSCNLVGAVGEFAKLVTLSCPTPVLADTAGSDCWSEGDPFSGLLVSSYHSSTLLSSDPTRAWYVSLQNPGFVNSLLIDSGPPGFAPAAWPVRDGP